MTEYKSSVLTCNVDDGDCAVCRFLNGDQDKETLMEVIRVLDVSSAKNKALINGLLNLIARDNP